MYGGRKSDRNEPVFGSVIMPVKVQKMLTVVH